MPLTPEEKQAMLDAIDLAATLLTVKVRTFEAESSTSYKEVIELLMAKKSALWALYDRIRDAKTIDLDLNLDEPGTVTASK